MPWMNDVKHWRNEADRLRKENEQLKNEIAHLKQIIELRVPQWAVWKYPKALW